VGVFKVDTENLPQLLLLNGQQQHIWSHPNDME
jgi:hypothetical protein